MSYPTMTTSIHNPHLRLLNALRANQKPIMSFVGLPSSRAAQVVAGTGLDVTTLLKLNGYVFRTNGHTGDNHRL
jgi:4-hydroxy-2-oxoheptanedioate aldolase